jgi:proline iminopeptidase
VDELTQPYPEIEPYDRGMLEVAPGTHVYWETCGSPDGKPAVVVHGGPGSGCRPSHRRGFDPAAYRIVLFDQRNCGRSTPHAGDASVSLEGNTTQNLISDMELLREHLGIDRWLLLGGSWGSTLALAYAEAFPSRVSEMILTGVTTSRRSEMDWLFRGVVSPIFPEPWARLCDAVPQERRSGDVVEDYRRLLADPDPAVRERAAFEWCMWESATPDWPPRTGLADRFTDPAFAMCFARLVTHYIANDVFLEEGVLLRDIDRLAGIPAILVNGRYDLQAPIGYAWELHRVWPGSELVIVGDAGHGGSPAVTAELVRAADRFAGRTDPG